MSTAALESPALDPDSATEAATPVRSAPTRRMVFGLLGAALLLGGGAYGFATRGHVTSDDAQIDADIVPVQAQLAGTIREVLFEENRPVHRGQLLVVLDDTEMLARVAEARANLLAAQAAARVAHADVDVVATRARGDASVASASARVASAAATTSVTTIAAAEASVASAHDAALLAASNLRRAQLLRDASSISEAAFEQTNTESERARADERAASARLAALRSQVVEARGAVQEARARVAQVGDVDVLVAQARAKAEQADAEVEVARARLTLVEVGLAHTRIIAPFDGYVSRRNAQIGQTVQVGHGLAQLVRTARWITANFKETQLEAMRVGQPVALDIDAYPNAHVWATIESLSGATGSRFTLLPPDNATGNFTKVVQRVPVRMRIGRIPEGVLLLPGMNVEVTVHTRAGRP